MKAINFEDSPNSDDDFPACREYSADVDANSYFQQHFRGHGRSGEGDLAVREIPTGSLSFIFQRAFKMRFYNSTNYNKLFLATNHDLSSRYLDHEIFISLSPKSIIL